MTKRKIKYMNEYRNETYDRIEFIAPKGTKKRIKEKAKAAGVSVSEYLTALVSADSAKENESAVLNGLRFTDAEKELLRRWQIPAKYFDMIQGVSVDTDEKRKEKAAAGARVACCIYSVYLKEGYINDLTGGRLIKTDKTKELRRIIVHTRAL